MVDAFEPRPCHPDARPPYLQPAGVGPNGRPLCRWCWGEVPKGRSKWCSTLCVEAYRIENDWNYCRRRVEERDGGVCVLCGTDTAWIVGAMDATLRAARCGPGGLSRPECFRLWRGVLDCEFPHRGWEADHIVARSEGGSDQLSNLRTLCVRCHKARTAEQRKRWAAKRRDERAGLFVGAGG